MTKQKRSLYILLLIGLATLAQQSPEEKEINEILNKKITYNRSQSKTNGFKIQLYNGGEKRAYEVKHKYFETFNQSAELVYESPEWKVRVGNFRTRIEADRALESIRGEFSDAIILETEIRK